MSAKVGGLKVVPAKPVAEFDHEEAERFAEFFYGDTREGCWYGLSWLTLDGKFENSAHKTLKVALEKAATLNWNTQGIYLRLTTTAKRPKGRGYADDSNLMFGFWADIDLGTEGHQHDPSKHGGLLLPADEDAAYAIIEASGLPKPTALVHSGGGLYPYWMLHEPLDIDATNLVGVARDSRALQLQLEAGAATLGAYYGTGIGDLARVLRIPGSWNRKTAVERRCEILWTDGPRYTHEEFRSALDAAGKVVQRPSDTYVGRAAPMSTEEQEALAFQRTVDPGPFDILEDEVGFDGVLKAAGWTDCDCGGDGSCGRREVEAAWTRPGGGSVTNHTAHTLNKNVHALVVHSAEAGLPAGGGQRLTVGKVFAHLHHRGDLSAAAQDVLAARQGGGSEHVRALVEYGLVIPEVFDAASDEGEGDDEGDPLAPLAGDDGRAELIADLIGEVTPAAQAPGSRRRSTMPDVGKMTFSKNDSHWVKTMAIYPELYEESDLRGRYPRLIRWRSEWWRWNGAHWSSYEGEALRRWIYKTAANTKDDANGIEDALRAQLLLAREHEQPRWLGAGEVPKGLFTGCRNGILELNTRALRPADPAFFNGFSVACDWDPNVEAPTRWLEFLDQIFDGQADQIQLLQEWFGYVLSGRIDLQKGVLFLGPTRSGKGTVVHVLRELIGAVSVTNPTFDSLSGDFGLAPLIGKRLAVVGDARLGNRANHAALQVLLSVIGRDNPTINRKGKEHHDGDSQVLFMVLSNEMPSFDDSSGAIVSRFEFLETQQSFKGREDTHLLDKLMRELPGILKWALDGYDRISVPDTKLTQPTSTAEAKAEMEERVSPLREWVRQRCVIEAGARTEVGDLYDSYAAWHSEGDGFRMDRRAFSKSLLATEPGLKRMKSGNARYLAGVRVLKEKEIEAAEKAAKKAAEVFAATLDLI